MFSGVHKRITRLVDPDGVVNVRIFGDRREWEPFMRGLIAEDQLPADYGGRALPFSALRISGFAGAAEGVRFAPDDVPHEEIRPYVLDSEYRDVSEEELAERTLILWHRRRFDVANTVLSTLVGLLIVVGIYVTVDFPWVSELVGWSLWAPVAMIGFGVLALLLNLCGFVGSRRRSPMLLLTYNTFMALAALTFATFAAASFWLAGSVTEVVGRSYEALAPAMPDEVTTREDVERHVEAYHVGWGVGGLLAALLCALMAALGHRYRSLARRRSRRPGPSRPTRRRRRCSTSSSPAASPRSSPRSPRWSASPSASPPSRSASPSRRRCRTSPPSSRASSA